MAPDDLARAQRAVSYTEISETLARYAQIIDRRELERLREVFTEDGTFDATSIGYEYLDGVDDIARHMETDAHHPEAHLVLNVVADINGDRASVTSRLIGVQPDGRLFVGEYQDQMGAFCGRLADQDPALQAPQQAVRPDVPPVTLVTKPRKSL